MTSDHELDVLRSAWSSQPVEETAMPAEEARRVAEAFRTRMGRRNLIEYIAGAIVVGVFGYFAVTDAPLLARAGAVLMIAGCIYAAWQLHRRASVRRAPAQPSARACLEFHRHELERQRDALNSVWRWYTAPLVPGLLVYAIGLVPVTGLVAASTVIAVSGLVFAGVVALNRRAARELQREIDQLPVN